MKILIIDNNIDPECWGSKDICNLARKAPDSTLYTRRAPQGDLPKSPQGFDRIIVSGSRTSSLGDSPWVGELIDFIKKAVELRKPFLGICFGHQILARALGGKEVVSVAAVPEYGWVQVELTEPSRLTQGLPPSFYSFGAHVEEVNQLPRGLKSFARSTDCQIQGFQHNELPVFGIQFHPEKSNTDAKKILKERKLTQSLSGLLNADRTEELYSPQVGETLFKNFFELGSNK